MMLHYNHRRDNNVDVLTTYCPSLGGSPVGLLATLLSVCPCVCSLHKCMRFKQQLGSTLHWTSGVGRLYFSSGPVQSVVAHSLPARFEILVVRARVCMTVQALALPALFILHCTKSGPPPSLSRCSITAGIANAGSAS